jgi:phospholipid-binding lipoprotein MlaA
MKELGRFMINSSIGVLGLFDVAKVGGIEPQEEDFGQTLGYYGVGSGFHVVLPFLGPSNLRDAIGFSVDSVIAPTSNASLKYQIPNNTEKALALSSIYYLNKNSLHPGEYQNLKKDALDVYTFFRDSYEQKRAKDIEK